MKDKIVIKNDKGESKEFEILFSFTSNNKNHITYTDFSKDKDNNIKCYSSIIKSDGQLLPIKNTEELLIINEMLNTINESTKIKYINE